MENDMQGTTGDGPGRGLRDVERWQEEGAVHLFRPWLPAVADAAGVKPMDRVLDVGCGTGVLSRYLTDERKARVTGIDQNEAMLSVASAISPQIRWDRGRAELLPYENNSFDAVVSQFALSLFHNAEDAVKEMIRVVRPGKPIAVAVWDSLGSTAAFQALRNLLTREFGVGLTGSFAYDTEKLAALFRRPGIHTPEIRTLKALTTFPTIRSWIRAATRWWTWAVRIDDRDLEGFLPAGEKHLAGFADARGRVVFHASAHIVKTVKEQLD